MKYRHIDFQIINLGALSLVEVLLLYDFLALPSQINYLKVYRTPFWTAVMTGLIVALLSACSGGSDGDTDAAAMSTYRITVTNQTNNQPLSPPASVLYTPGYSPWETGDSASEGLEMLAEGGDTSGFLDEAMTNAHISGTGKGAAVGPGGTQTVEISVKRDSDLRLGFATMLVNTNDAFVGVKDQIIGSLEMDEKMAVHAIAYDAGTESNDETAANIPGSAAGGEGFTPDRNDRNFVAAHSGVVTADDGLVTSVLDESHRWLNPAVRLVVTRIQ